MRSKRTVGIVSWLVTLVALFSLYLALVGLPPRVDPRPHRALGETVAKEALKLLGSGGRLMLISRDTTVFRNSAADFQIQQFHKTIQKAGAKVATTNLIKLDPLRLATVPAGDFFQLAKKASEADVIVSFISPPSLAVEQLARLGDKRPKVIAVCTGNAPSQVNLKRILEEQMMNVAVISRKDVPATPPSSDSPQAWFDYLFRVVTPATAPELLTQMTTQP